MLACIIGNVYSGLMILALQSKLNQTDAEEVSGIWIMWRVSYNKLHKFSAKALGSAGRMYCLHHRFLKKYPEASMLNPIKIYTKTNRPRMTKVLTPLIKVFNKYAMSRYDNDVLQRKDFNQKLKLYLLMKQSFYRLKSILRDKRIEDSQTHMLHNLFYQQALEYNNISVKLNKVANLRTLRHYKKYQRQAQTVLEKARGVARISEMLLKVKSQPNFKIANEVQQVRSKVNKAVKATIQQANYKEEIEERSDANKQVDQLTLAEKLKIKRKKLLGDKTQKTLEKLKQISILRHLEKHSTGSSSSLFSDANFLMNFKPREETNEVTLDYGTIPSNAIHPLNSRFEMLPFDSEIQLRSPWSSIQSMNMDEIDMLVSPAGKARRSTSNASSMKPRHTAKSVGERETTVPTPGGYTMRRDYDKVEDDPSEASLSAMFNSQVNRQFFNSMKFNSGSASKTSTAYARPPSNFSETGFESRKNSQEGASPLMQYGFTSPEDSPSILLPAERKISKGYISRKLELLRKRLQ
jgi:hypothetical protein